MMLALLIGVLSVFDLLPERPGLPADEYVYRFEASNSRGDFSAAFVEEALTSPIPETSDELYLEFSQNGNRSHYEAPYFLREDYLDALAVAEFRERTGRCLPKIEALLAAMADMKTWVLPAHDGDLRSFRGERHRVDLFASQYAAHIACVLQMVGDRLDPRLVRRLRDLVEERIFAPLRTDIPLSVTQGADPKACERRRPRHSWIDSRYNWNAVCWNNVVCAALYFLDDRRERAFFVEAALKSLPTFLSGFAADGYCHEGMGYWNYGFGYHLMMARLLREVSGGKLDAVSDPRERVIAAYGRGDAFDLESAPSFADGGGAPSAAVLRLVDGFWPDLPKTFAPSTAFPEAQVWLFRDPEGLSVALKGGDNGVAHNHNDLGSYEVQVRGRRAFGDPGREVYTARTFSGRRYESKVLNSYGHPVPVVGGKLQSTGAQFRAQVVSSHIDDSGVSEIVLELKDAYEVPALQSLQRRFRYDRPAKTLEIVDCVRFSEPTAFEDAYTVLDGGCPRPTVAVMGAGYALREERIDNPGRLSPLRCGVVLDVPVRTAEVRLTFSDGIRK